MKLTFCFVFGLCVLALAEDMGGFYIMKNLFESFRLLTV